VTGLLTLDSVTKVYRRGSESVHALDDVSVALEAGELVALAGPSGSGKTTLLNVLAGFEQPDAGRVTWGGGPSLVDSVGWNEIAAVPQRLGLLEELTLAENVGLPLRLAGLPDHTGRAAHLLEALGLVDLAHRRPGQVSLGEQQRAAVARALVRRPRLVLADEPTGHQDKLWGARVFRVLHAAAREDGTTSVVATHSTEFLAEADRVISMRDGRLGHHSRTRPQERAGGRVGDTRT
jgi:putative ABC transport system ATP-binding protein